MTIFVIKISGNGNEVIRDGLFAARNFNWFVVWFADCFYATVGAFGLTLISDFLLEYQIIINIFGGGLILFMGIRLLIKKDKAVFLNENTTGILKMFFPLLPLESQILQRSSHSYLLFLILEFLRDRDCLKESCL